MTEQETQGFRLLGDYARARHDCFLAEFWLKKGTSQYALCFRPASVKADDRDADVYACTYIHLEQSDVLAAAATRTLPQTAAEIIDTMLPSLTRKR